jgi:hypothetical protein
MKIEALETIKAAGYVLDAGDVKQNVPDEIGSKWVQAGWAKDLDGGVPTGERKVLDARLVVEPTVIGVVSPDMGVK